MSEQPIDRTERKIFGFNLNVFFLGIVSLLTDISSEMIFTLVPLFLSNVLGAATTIVGLAGGISDSVDSLFRIAGGWLSDKFRKRKGLMVVGYSLSTVVKPLMYIASTWGVVVGVRFLDRVGKGIRSSPRDALVAASVSKGERGKAFGLHRAMDTAGAFIGLAAAAYIIYVVQGGGLKLSLEAYRWIVLVGVIPAVLAVLVLILFVREKTPPANNDTRPATPVRFADHFDRRFRVFLVIMAVFTLGKSSDFFVILRAQNLEVPLIQVTLMLVLLNITYSLVSIPAGMLSDKLGRRRVIIVGWFIYALVYLGFALATNLWSVWLLFAGYGIYQGVVEGVARAFVADLVAEPRRGTAYGLYHGVVGLLALPASLIAGWLWEIASPAAPFYFGAGLSFVSAIGLWILVKE